MDGVRQNPDGGSKKPAMNVARRKSGGSSKRPAMDGSRREQDYEATPHINRNIYTSLPPRL